MAIVVALLIGACASSDDGKMHDLAPLPTSESEFQQKILADDQVTFAEYEQAVAALVECLNARGFRAEYMDNGAGMFQVSVQPGSAGNVSPDAAYDDCSETFTTEVELAYSLRLPTSASPFENALASCLRKSGLLDLEDPTVGQLEAMIEERGTDDPHIKRCHQEATSAVKVGGSEPDTNRHTSD